MPIEINGLTTNHSNSRQRNEAAKSAGSDKSSESNHSNSSEQANASDSVHLSSEARGLQKLEEKANGLPDVDMDRVAEIKAAIENGSYQPDPKKIAEKMMKFDDLM